MHHTRKDVELLSKEPLYHGRYEFDRYRMRYRTYSGAWSKDVEREILDRGNTVSLLPYDPQRDLVVLIEQFRPGAFANDDPHPWLWEIVAGVMEDGEQPLEVAARECEEETGLKTTALKPIREYYTSPGAVVEYNRMFVGRVDASAAGGLHGLHEEGEDIRVFTLTAAEAFAAVDEGKFRTAPALIGLAWLKDKREQLRAEWR
jgi:ADP-ribose pyrophosphatase